MALPGEVIHRLGDDWAFDHSFWCPGCQCGHVFNAYINREPRWNFNGDLTRPTLDGSLLVRSGNANGPTVCHSFVKDGQIQFLGDCTHELAGKTVPLEQF
jgi:hypothetical protein